MTGASRTSPCSRPGSRVGRRAPLHELADGLDPGGPQTLPHLRELVVFVDPLSQHGDEEAALGLSPGRGVRLVLGHTWIMPRPRREAK